jgi:hypothetical protein
MAEYLQIETHDLPNQNFILVNAPEQVMSEIKEQVNGILSGTKPAMLFNKRLAGQIKGEFGLEFSDASKQLIEFLGAEYIKKNKMVIEQPVKFQEAWMNLQVKHEYNPLHDHSGVLSWVIWVNIPYDLEEELKTFPDAKNQDASMFSFVYTNVLGEISTFNLRIDKSWEGRMVIFPAKMKHMVAPFYTSDGIRISVAGNLG